MELLDDNYCFACGKENPIGLKLNFKFEEDRGECRFTPQREHQGWTDVIHGGILFTLMDEVMARLIINKGYPVVTSRMDTRFLRPAVIGEELLITARILAIGEKTITADSRIVNSKNKIIASSKGTYSRVKG